MRYMASELILDLFTPIQSPLLLQSSPSLTPHSQPSPASDVIQDGAPIRQLQPQPLKLQRQARADGLERAERLPAATGVEGGTGGGTVEEV